ncbi:MAG TPA: hypothetical protein VND93_22195, partial [Myxococcales bacterium]|nr:hypothetical protein [Myxococcales bacterium]
MAAAAGGTEPGATESGAAGGAELASTGFEAAGAGDVEGGATEPGAAGGAGVTGAEGADLGDAAGSGLAALEITRPRRRLTGGAALGPGLPSGGAGGE